MTTVVFADIVGSTSLYETLGNEHAALMVTEVVQWMAGRIQAEGGRVIKTLGDGIMALFDEPSVAVEGMLNVMRAHRERISRPIHKINPDVRVGLDCGEVVDVGGDCYGDAVNTAARLCDRAAAGEIWATEAVVRATAEMPTARFVRLGHLKVRGKSEPLLMYQIEWRTEEGVEQLTQHAGLTEFGGVAGSAPLQIQFSWGRAHMQFRSSEVPVHLGRSSDAHLYIDDPRVSRLHARIDWHDGTFKLTDLSTFGTWVRFDGSDTPIQLRRDSCVLHGNGEMALSVPFTADDAPRIAFQVTGPHLRFGEGQTPR
ncbi:adenylate/guanylate cyclase domain-containing protein [Diaphorobacter aerolatus]|uniref:FHA domain-containing protein n=1 Tax=Diaphorobacter aerolatus TaxID=1288495 RepID=A0A7H0GKD7_9BURK|nr:adenylate/guanylate cyclase domain-containing protein [Diaphorobacter aerolatus]QNP48753.1 FHA domain-containing protein [Diaphorobacter aerolatus]